MVSSSFWFISFLFNSFFILSGKTHSVIDARIRGNPPRQFCTTPLGPEEQVGRMRQEKFSWTIRSAGIWSHVLGGWYPNWHNVIVYSSRFYVFFMDILTLADETYVVSKRPTTQWCGILSRRSGYVLHLCTNCRNRKVIPRLWRRPNLKLHILLSFNKYSGGF